MGLFHRKKTLDKIPLGDLHIMKAEIEWNLDRNATHLHDVDEQIQQILFETQTRKSEDGIEFAAKQISHLIEAKRLYLAEKENYGTKLLALEKLIRAKEMQQTFPRKHQDILDVLDVDGFLEDQETQRIQTELGQMQLEKVLDYGSSADYTKITTILNSLCFDTEDVVLAKTELDELTVKRRV